MPNAEKTETAAGSQQPIASYKRLGFSLDLYPNRIEVSEVGVLGMRRRRVILLRNIASVERHAATSRITVKTNDGQKFTWALGFETGRIYEAIMAAL